MASTSARPHRPEPVAPQNSKRPFPTTFAASADAAATAAAAVVTPAQTHELMAQLHQELVKLKADDWMYTEPKSDPFGALGYVRRG
jgi:hypothetical protein